MSNRLGLFGSGLDFEKLSGFNRAGRRSKIEISESNLTIQMAEWYRASASGSVDLGFDSESGQTNDLKTGIHSLPA